MIIIACEAEPKEEKVTEMAKRGHPPKTKRNEELVKIRDQMDLSFERLGKIYGISKQAAHKIYQREQNNAE